MPPQAAYPRKASGTMAAICDFKLDGTLSGDQRCFLLVPAHPGLSCPARRRESGRAVVMDGARAPGEQEWVGVGQRPEGW
jgi:hypothetical protein